MLQDALWARASWLAEDGNEDVATRFLRASFKGWIYCRENPDDCVQYALDHGSQSGRRPPGLDDERGQRADLAVAGWDRRARPGCVCADDRDRDRRRDPRPRTRPTRPSAPTSPRRPCEGIDDDVDRRGLGEAGRRGHAGRRIGPIRPPLERGPSPLRRGGAVCLPSGIIGHMPPTTPRAADSRSMP